MDNSQISAEGIPQCSQHPDRPVGDVCVNQSFEKIWPVITDDNALALFGFRRYRTSHLLNLRFLEEEIAKIDHKIFQAGLRLEKKRTGKDRLALSYASRDSFPEGGGPLIDDQLKQKLRALLKEYG